MDVAGDVGGELRVDLVEHVAAVVERPHLAHGLVADPGDDALDVVETVSTARHLSCQSACSLGGRLKIEWRVVALSVGQRRGVRGLVLHVVHARADVDDRLQGRMGGDVGHPLAVDPHLAPVA